MMRSHTGVNHRGVMREYLIRHLLAVVLTLVLVWYTVAIPASTRAPDRSAGDRGTGAEEQGACTGDGTGRARSGGASSADDLDWPEIICEGE